MVALALLLSTIARFDPAITIESQGITVKSFCAELSRQSGRTYLARDEVQSDLLAIRLDHVALSDVLARLTWAERAKIEFDGKAYNIEPDLLIREQLREENLARRTKLIQAILDRMSPLVRQGPMANDEAKTVAKDFSDAVDKHDAAILAGDPNRTPLHVRQQDQLLRLPVGQSMLRMLLAIGAPSLAAIKPGSTAVWSTDPTRVEQALPQDDWIGDLKADARAWNDYGRNFLSIGGAKWLNLPGKSLAQIGNAALLRFQCDAAPGYNPSLIYELTAFDASGEKISSSIASTWTQESADDAAWAKAQSSQWKPIRVAVPATTAMMLELWAGYPGSANKGLPVKDSAFNDVYFNPEKHDPISETFGWCAVNLAKALKKSLIAVEPADVTFLSPKSIKGKVDLGQFQFNLTKSSHSDARLVEVTDDTSWCAVRPGDLDRAASEEFDREALGSLLRTARDNGSLTIMDVAGYAAESDEMFEGYGLSALPHLVRGLKGMELLRDGPWSLKSFLGRLQPIQISEGQKSGGLGLASCTAPQLEALWQTLQLDMFEWNGRTDVWRCYATDGAPNGLPGGGTLHLSISNGDAILVRVAMKADHFRSLEQFFSPEEWAAEFTTKSGRASMAGYDVVGIKPASQVTYNFLFSFPGEVSKTYQLTDTNPTGPSVKSIEALPDSIREEIKTALAKATP